MTRPAADPRLLRARQHAERGETLQAELLYLGVLGGDPACAQAARAVAALAARREDWPRALHHYQVALQAEPDDDATHLEMAQVLCQLQQPEAAASVLRQAIRSRPDQPLAWLLLGDVLETLGQPVDSCKARYQAITRAHKAGVWTDVSNTHPALVDQVLLTMEKVTAGRRAHLLRSFDATRLAFGAKSVERIERALLGYLGEIDTTPPDPRQRPKFLYIPGLPDHAYHDPALQPWSEELAAGWMDLRAEASYLLGDNSNFESFLGIKVGESNAEYVSGSGPNPAWDAFFFYRHGERFDANHARCPKTSALIDSLSLCRVRHQAPEVCFSVIRPGSKIMPHHGVTNSRLVMHLPLVVPSECALNIVGVGEHRWREGELMMFDDTFQHEAWNDSEQSRVILLMDCWNPHLSSAEQMAVKQLVEAIDDFESV